MPKLYGELVADNKMKVTMISWSGNKPGGVEVEEVLEGEGIHYVDPATGEQWYESGDKEDKATELKRKLNELNSALESMVGGRSEMGD